MVSSLRKWRRHLLRFYPPRKKGKEGDLSLALHKETKTRPRSQQTGSSSWSSSSPFSLVTIRLRAPLPSPFIAIKPFSFPRSPQVLPSSPSGNQGPSPPLFLSIGFSDLSSLPPSLPPARSGVGGDSRLFLSPWLGRVVRRPPSSYFPSSFNLAENESSFCGKGGRKGEQQEVASSSTKGKRGGQ